MKRQLFALILAFAMVCGINHPAPAGASLQGRGLGLVAVSASAAESERVLMYVERGVESLRPWMYPWSPWCPCSGGMKSVRLMSLREHCTETDSVIITTRTAAKRHHNGDIIEACPRHSDYFTNEVRSEPFVIGRCTWLWCRTCHREGSKAPDDAVVVCLGWGDVGGVEATDRMWSYYPVNNTRLAQLVSSGRIPANVTHLRLHSNAISDLTPLSTLTDLVWLDLEQNEISDLTPLSTLTNLERLDLDYNGDIDDLSPLSTLVNMIELDINSNQVTDLSPLMTMAKLERLDLKGSIVTDLTPLAGLTNLWELELNFSMEVSDISPLANLTAMRRLTLSNTNVTDISVLANFTQLERLELTNVPVVNADLSVLYNLTKLQRLTIRGIPGLGVRTVFELVDALRELEEAPPFA
ncbi:MAG: hypothetical protein FWD35_06445, partial [Oscillospiraceae bacterium]|nr:hypothetical protein [Oscillospiraceae bacterium]